MRSPSFSPSSDVQRGQSCIIEGIARNGRRLTASDGASREAGSEAG